MVAPIAPQDLSANRLNAQSVVAVIAQRNLRKEDTDLRSGRVNSSLADTSTQVRRVQGQRPNVSSRVMANMGNTSDSQSGRTSASVMSGTSMPVRNDNDQRPHASEMVRATARVEDLQSGRGSVATLADTSEQIRDSRLENTGTSTMTGSISQFEDTQVGRSFTPPMVMMTNVQRQRSQWRRVCARASTSTIVNNIVSEYRPSGETASGSHSRIALSGRTVDFGDTVHRPTEVRRAVGRCKYTSAEVRRSARQQRRAGHQRVRQTSTELNQKAQLILYTTAEITVPAMSTQRIRVETREKSRIQGSYFCQNYSQQLQNCMVCNGYWDGTDDSIPVLCTNTSEYPQRIGQGTPVVRAHPQATWLASIPERLDQPTRSGEVSSQLKEGGETAANFNFDGQDTRRNALGRPYTEDIRLTPKYLQHVEQQLRINKRRFWETCHNGGDLRQQRWHARSRVWVNPPWQLSGLVIAKLLQEMPKEFVLVLPVPRETSDWDQVLREIPIPQERRMILPKTEDVGYFQLYYDNKPKPGPPLPFPAWETQVIHGFRTDLERIPPERRISLAERVQAHLLPVLTESETSTEWLHGVQVGELTKEQIQQLVEVLQRYKTVLKPDQLGLTNASQCTIPIQPGVQPIASRPYVYSLKEKEIIEREIQDMLAKGVIEPSSAAWSAPVVLVKKKDGAIRFCVDYRKLNSVTSPDNFPLPRLEDTLDTLAGNAVFSTMDLKSGYWQIPVAEEDKDKTSFVTHQGLHRWTRAPFGLRNMPAIFQRLMTKVLAGLTWTSVLVYIDDLIVFGRDFQEHLLRLDSVLVRLKAAGLTVNLDKCCFGMLEVHHLGHIISARGIQPDPKKMAAVANMVAPRNVKGVQQFLGVMNWFRKFIPNFSEVAAPLNHLTKKTTEFNWTGECEQAFRQLKELLVTAPILRLPDPRRPFVLMTDASDKQIGAVLLQKDSDDDELHPVSYLSRTLDVHQARYATIEKECLALVWAVQEHRKLLYGQKFLVKTDHRPLMWLMTKNELPPKLTRWALILQEYDLQIVYGPGSDNVIADALSRLEIGQPYSVNEYKEIDLDAPELPRTEAAVVCAVLPSQYIGRELSVPGIWWSVKWARANKAMRKFFRCTVESYDAQEPNGRGFRVCLPKESTSGQTTDEFFQMKQSAVEAYLVGDRPKGMYDNVQAVNADGDDGEDEGEVEVGDQGTVNAQVNDVAEEIPTVAELRDLAPASSAEIDVAELKDLQSRDPKLRVILAELSAEQQDAVKTDGNHGLARVWKDRVAREFLLDERGLLIHVEPYETTTRRSFRQQLVVPETLKERVMYLHHASAPAAHVGMARTYMSVREKYYWQGMKLDIRRYVLACHCQGIKQRAQEVNFADTKLNSYWPNDLVAIDCAGPLPASAHGNRYMVLMQDCFTKYIEVVCVPQLNAAIIAHAIFYEWIRRYGPMRRLLSDNGPEFQNELVIQGLCDLCGVSKVFTTAYHPQSNGTVERLVRTVKQLLVAQMDSLPGSWDDRVPLISFAYNHTLHGETGEVPYYLWYGRPPVALTTLLNPSEGQSASQTVQEYREEVWHRLATAFELVRQHQEAERELEGTTRALKLRQEHWEVGDLAWLHRPSLVNSFNSRKMFNPWEGPGQVLRVESPTRLVVLLPSRRDPRRAFTVHPDRLRRYTVPFYQPWQQPGRPLKFPLTLLSKRLRLGRVQYRVRWLSVAPTPDTWVASEQLPVHLTETYEARQRLASTLVTVAMLV